MPTIDYLRFGTFSSSAHAILMSCLPSEQRKATHWLQYAGEGSKHTFGGGGNQDGRRHYITHASGPAASIFAHRVRTIPNPDLLDRDDNIRCRRIDLCHDIIEDLNVDNLADELSMVHDNVTIMKSPDGWTIYVNKRQGDFMTRIYRKKERGLTRCEFECKGRLADNVWSMIYGGTTHRLDGIYNSLLRRARLGRAEPIFSRPEVPEVEILRRKYDEDVEKKIQWMFNAFSGIEKLIMDHTSRDRALDALMLFASRMRDSTIKD